MAAEKVYYTCCGANPKTGKIPESKRLAPSAPACEKCAALLEAFWKAMGW